MGNYKDSTTPVPPPIGIMKYNVIELLGLEQTEEWRLFDGQSSSLNGQQIVLGVYPDQHFQFKMIDLEEKKLDIDFAMDGHIIAVVYEDTKKFEHWTPTAALIASSPVFKAVLEEIASGEAPFDPRVLAEAALQYM